MESLEPRRLMAAVYPSAGEQYLLELVNRARANPAAEAARLGVSLNEGLAPGTLSTAARQPLAFNPNLGAAAHSHTQWMLDTDTFTHNQGSATPVDQIRSAGYAFTGRWEAGQNIWWYGYTPPKQPPLYATIDRIHHDLFVDSGIAGRTHRINILKGDFKELGTGVLTGVYKTGGRAYNAVGVTEDFAGRNLGQTGAFLTGVAYRDANANHFYTPGEGLGGVRIAATRVGGGTYSTTTWDAGGYSLKLPAGTYRVTATGGAFAAATAPVVVKIGSKNVKTDFDPRTGTTTFAAASVRTGTLSATATNNARFSVARSGVAGSTATSALLKAFAGVPGGVMRPILT